MIISLLLYFALNITFSSKPGQMPCGNCLCLESAVQQTNGANARSRIESLAAIAFREGERLRAEGKAEYFNRAIKVYDDARRLWKAAGHKAEEIRSLQAMADVHSILGDNRKALLYERQALSLSQAIKDQQAEIKALNGIGYLYVDLGQAKAAMSFCNQALSLASQVQDLRGQAQALSNIGLIHYSLSDMPKARDSFKQALRLWETAKDRCGQASTLNNLGYTAEVLGDIQAAYSNYNQALTLFIEENDLRGKAQSLTAIGGLSSLAGEKQEALDFHEQALDLFRQVGDLNGQAATLNGLGYAYEDLGDARNAFHFYDEALTLYRRTGNRNYECLSMGYVGEIYYSLGNKKKALGYYKQKLALSRLLGDRQMQAYTLRDIGQIYESSGNRDVSLNWYYRALAFSKAVLDKRGQANILNSIGFVYASNGQKQQALDTYHQALSLIRAASDRRAETQALHNIARVERDLGRLDDALLHIEEAVRLIDFLRTRVKVQELRASYFASAYESYQLYIDVLMQKHRQRTSHRFDIRAFEINERSRARVLLEEIGEAQVRLHEGGDPVLLDLDRSLRQQLESVLERQTRLLYSHPESEQAKEVRKEADVLLLKYREVQARLKEQSSRYTELTQPQPLTVSEIRQQVLDPDTLLLEYSLGAERSYLWVISRDSLEAYELPSRSAIEAVAKPILDVLMLKESNRDGRILLPQDAAKQYWKQSMRLSEVLLGPVVSRLNKSKLLIVPDGVLQYVPFNGLPHPKLPTQESNNQVASISEPLIVAHEVVILPSASLIVRIRQEIRHRPIASKTVAVFADPVFKKTDPRVTPDSRVEAKSTSERPPIKNLSPAFTDFRGKAAALDFPRLLYTREEAKTIMTLVPPENVMAALDFQASLENATGTDLSQYQVIHFATHGLFDSEHPELSAIVLSLVDERGKSRNGFLRLFHIYNLKLSADLVVLSACSTAIGRDIKGEGVIGLTRGFMYAGAPSVLTSLWRVDDEATAELMSRFYERMLKDGHRPAAALRQAQIEMWKDPQWNPPCYWAAFVLQGEWK